MLLADGSSKPIEDIDVGDEVLAADPVTGEQSAEEVTHVWVHENDLTELETTAGTVVTTEDHPFWNETDQQWRQADELDAGESLLTAAGGTVSVVRLDPDTVREDTAYNLTVERLHTYYVLINDTPVLVHNTCDSLGLDVLSQSGARSSKGELTQAGRKLSQHGGQGPFPKPTGSAADLNRLGQEQLDDILTGPGTIIRPLTGGNFTGGSYYIAADGRGAVFEANGVFQYFGVFKP